MVKKQKSFWIYIIIAIVIVVGGILIYNFLKEKPEGSDWFTPTDEEKLEEAVSTPSSEEETGIISKIKSIFGGSGGVGSGGGGGGTSGGTGGDGTPTYETDQTICQNSQNNNLCEGLDLIYGEGYRTLCCSEHSLCC